MPRIKCFECGKFISNKIGFVLEDFLDKNGNPTIYQAKNIEDLDDGGWMCEKCTLDIYE